jgi:hypothetical protein
MPMTKTRKTTIGIRRLNLCRGRRIVTPRPENHANLSRKAHPSNRVVNVRPNNVAMILIAVKVVAKAVAAATVAVAVAVDGVAEAIALMTGAVRPAKTSRSVRRGTTRPRRFPPATTGRSILIPSRWTRSVPLPAMTVSARPILNRTKTKAAKTAPSKMLPVNVNSVKNLLKNARPRRSKLANSASQHSKTRAPRNENQNSVATNPVNAASLRRKVAATSPMAIAPKAVGIIRRTTASKVVASRLTAADNSMARADAAIVATAVVPRPVVVGAVIGSNSHLLNSANRVMVKHYGP